MTRNEFVLMRIKDDRKTYKGVEITWWLAGIGCLVALVAGLMLRGARALVFLGAAFGCACSALAARGKVASFDQALSELGDASGEHDVVDYSRTTLDIIDSVWMDPKTLLQMAIAYGVMVPFMIAGGAVIVWASDDAPILALLGVLLAFGGVLLAILAWKALRARKYRLQFRE